MTQLKKAAALKRSVQSCFGFWIMQNKVWLHVQGKRENAFDELKVLNWTDTD